MSNYEFCFYSKITRRKTTIECVNYVSMDLHWFQDFIECLSHDMSLHGKLVWSQRLAKVFPAMQIGWTEYNLCLISPQKIEFHLLQTCRPWFLPSFSICAHLETRHLWNYPLKDISCLGNSTAVLGALKLSTCITKILVSENNLNER